MKNLGKITDPLDIATKEYVDKSVAGGVDLKDIDCETLVCNGVDMTIDEETIALWTKIIGGRVTLKGLLLNIAHPVGSIIQTTKSQEDFDPNTVLGGTWVLLKDRFLLGAGGNYTLGATGGSPNAVVVSHTHTQVAHSHTVASAGAHTHTAMRSESKSLASGSVASRIYSVGNGGGSTSHATSSNGAHNHTVSGGATATGAAGVAAAGKNMPPYKAVNIWERTA